MDDEVVRMDDTDGLTMVDEEETERKFRRSAFSSHLEGLLARLTLKEGALDVEH